MQDALLTNTWGQQGPWEGAKNSTAGNGEAFSKSSGSCYSSCMGPSGTHRLALKHSLFFKAPAENKCGGLGALLQHVRNGTVIRSHGNSLSRSWVHLHTPRGVCLATPSQTNAQCSPPFPDLKFLMSPLLVWPLRIKGLSLFFISHVSVYNPLDT